MEGWQRRSREEREFLSGKFREARALVERLAQENKNLLGKLNLNGGHVASQGTAVVTETTCQSRSQESSCADSNGLLEDNNVSLQKYSQVFFYSDNNKLSKHDICPEYDCCVFMFVRFCFQVLAAIDRKVDAEQDTDRQTMPRSLVENLHFPLYTTKLKIKCIFCVHLWT